MQFLANAAKRNPAMSMFDPEVARAGAAAGSPPWPAWKYRVRAGSRWEIEGLRGAIPFRAPIACLEQDPDAPSDGVQPQAKAW